MSFRALLAVAALAVASSAFATPQPRNLTDMWFNPAESGWGLNVIHQGDTLFASLFVYAQDGQPKWYTASSMTGVPSSYSGALNECAGSWFGGTFDPRALSCRQVGTMTLSVGDSGGTLDYTVDGVHVTKQVTRFSFRAVDLTGQYRATVFQPAGSGLPQVRREIDSFGVADVNPVSIATSSDSELSCLYTGNHAQDGQVVSVAGDFECGAPPTGPEGGWSMRVDPTPSGFVGAFKGGNPTTVSGRIAAALNGTPKMEGTGWRNGMWFVPAESGWGVNVIEQGDTIFATLFVYDAQGKAHWFVASQLIQSGMTADGTAINSGLLFEATGPYFGASAFNPSAVTRRQVGTMSFQVRSPGSATLTYTVDGVQVTKTVTNFAFRRNDPSGSYTGQITGNGAHDPAAITLNDSGGSFSMTIAGMTGGACTYTGTSQQIGDAINASGTAQCSFGGSASFVLKNLIVESDGITGRVEFTNVIGFVQDGLTSFNMAGARTG